MEWILITFSISFFFFPKGSLVFFCCWHMPLWGELAIFFEILSNNCIFHNYNWETVLFTLYCRQPYSFLTYGMRLTFWCDGQLLVETTRSSLCYVILSGVVFHTILNSFNIFFVTLLLLTCNDVLVMTSCGYVLEFFQLIIPFVLSI